MVKKLATSLNAKINHPYKDMSVGSKNGLVESYLSENSSYERSNDRSKVVSSEELPQNAHERDALAAAIKTFKKYQMKLGHAENRAQNAGLSCEEIETIKIMFIEGTAISSAIRSLVEMQSPENDINQESEENSVQKVEPDTISKLKHKIRLQEKQIKNLKNKNTALEGEIKEYKLDVANLHHKFDKLHHQYSQDILHDKEIAAKISFINKLQDKFNEERNLRIELERNLKSMKNIQRMDVSDNSIPVKIIESFTREGINKACEYWKIKRGDVVLLESSEGGGSQTASLLVKMGVKAVLVMDRVSHQAEEEFEKNMVPLLQADHLNLKSIDQFAIVGAPRLKKAIEKWNAKIENKRNKENTQEILKVIDEYRAKRKRNNHSSF